MESSEGQFKRSKPDITEYGQTYVNHPTLCLYYAQVLTLRSYLVSTLPLTSKTRRRRIVSAADSIFDRTLVCVRDVVWRPSDSSWLKDREAFSQRISLTTGSSIGARSSQTELIDFAVWNLFNRIYRHVHRPPHMLCHGYQRVHNPRQNHGDHCAIAGIPGLVSYYPNSNVDLLKGAAWTEILGLLGKDGDQIMLDMVLHCSLFVAVDAGQGNFYQLSGKSTSITPEAYSTNNVRHSHDRIANIGLSKASGFGKAVAARKNEAYRCDIVN